MKIENATAQCYIKCSRLGAIEFKVLGRELFSNEIKGIVQRDVNLPAEILYEAHLSLETFM